MAFTASGVLVHHDEQVAHDQWLSLTSVEPVLEPELPIVDAHHHLWDKHPSRHFVGRYMMEELAADVLSTPHEQQHHNVVATVYMQSSSAGWLRAEGSCPDALRPIGEVEFVTGVAAMGESGLYGPARTCAGIVGTADLLLGDAVEEVVAASQAAGRNFRGIRFRGAKAESIPFDDPQYFAGLRVLERRGLVYDCTGPQTHPLDFAGVLGGLCRAAAACPQLTIVVDHCGGAVGPRLDAQPEKKAEWEAAIRALAACPNIYMKVGGMTMEINGFPIGRESSAERAAQGSISSAELVPLVAPYLRFVIEEFGPTRCMFESNFPMDKWGVSYVVLWNTFKRLAVEMGLSAEEKTALFSGTAASVYKLRL